MSQNATVMAFRKRLSKRGYKNISIYKIKGLEAIEKPDTYKISAIEPLGNTEVKTEYTMTKMYYTFK